MRRLIRSGAVSSGFTLFANVCPNYLMSEFTRLYPIYTICILTQSMDPSEDRTWFYSVRSFIDSQLISFFVG